MSSGLLRMSAGGCPSSSLPCVSRSLSSPFHSRRSPHGLLKLACGSLVCNLRCSYNTGGHQTYYSFHRVVKSRGQLLRWKATEYAVSVENAGYDEAESDYSDDELQSVDEGYLPATSSTSVPFEGAAGRPGVLSFYNRPYKQENDMVATSPPRTKKTLGWILGPAVLVVSFIFPSLYLRRMLSFIFEDSLLTDFLILFFTEALFYCGVAVFLLLIDRTRRSIQSASVGSSTRLTFQFGQRVSLVATMVLSLIVPMVTMGLVWPWTGPAASAALAPYLAGIIVQFAFEQYARLRKSPSSTAIPLIFQVYRLHQLNRAAQLVTALSFTVRGAEVTPEILAINSSLGTLLNVLQFLGVVCIWSLSSLLMRIFASYTIGEE
ncbi:hypothetical protein MLD38_021865 [Melastoma candidum]|uniref:Uncharacterized protein n=1 Tax=Melastoma candidum TaxID=119954 RepID=A0ACB9QIC9_9MYRT|nr:hypothetical protein MLD38_021865 [Melastoma candidum]